MTKAYEMTESEYQEIKIALMQFDRYRGFNRQEMRDLIEMAGRLPPTAEETVAHLQSIAAENAYQAAEEARYAAIEAAKERKDQEYEATLDKVEVSCWTKKFQVDWALHGYERDELLPGAYYTLNELREELEKCDRTSNRGSGTRVHIWVHGRRTRCKYIAHAWDLVNSISGKGKTLIPVLPKD